MTMFYSTLCHIPYNVKQRLRRTTNTLQFTKRYTHNTGVW